MRAIGKASQKEKKKTVDVMHWKLSKFTFRKKGKFGDKEVIKKKIKITKIINEHLKTPF